MNENEIWCFFVWEEEMNKELRNVFKKIQAEHPLIGHDWIACYECEGKYFIGRNRDEGEYLPNIRIEDYERIQDGSLPRFSFLIRKRGPDIFEIAGEAIDGSSLATGFGNGNRFFKYWLDYTEEYASFCYNFYVEHQKVLDLRIEKEVI